MATAPNTDADSETTNQAGTGSDLEMSVTEVSWKLKCIYYAVAKGLWNKYKSIENT